MFLNTYSPNPVKKHAQSGAALVVSLIMLSLMTAIGVAAMETTILESKMAGNMQAEVNAFNNADSSLRLAESAVRLEANNSTPANFTTQVWLYNSADTIPSLSNLDSLNSAAGDNSRYIVQYLGARALAGESSALNSAGGVTGSSIHIFQINATNDDTGQGAIQIVRSTYATVNAP